MIISGKALSYTGSPVDSVVIFDWESGATIINIHPSNDGVWEYPTEAYGKMCGVTYTSKGCKPLTHGPYTIGTTPLTE